MATEQIPQESTPAPAKEKKHASDNAGHVASDRVKLIQGLLVSQERKRMMVEALQAKVNQGEVMVEAESKNIAKEAERKRISLKLEIERAQAEFEKRFEQIDTDERAALATLRRDVEIVRQAFNREQKALGQINTQIGRELVKMGVIEVSLPEPIPVPLPVKP